jgi:hypothetical protein
MRVIRCAVVGACAAALAVPGVASANETKATIWPSALRLGGPLLAGATVQCPFGKFAKLTVTYTQGSVSKDNSASPAPIFCWGIDQPVYTFPSGSGAFTAGTASATGTLAVNGGLTVPVGPTDVKIY